jgi:hypothetical protein
MLGVQDLRDFEITLAGSIQMKRMADQPSVTMAGEPLRSSDARS